MNKPKRAWKGWRHGAWPAAIACTVVAAAASTAYGQCQYEVTIIQAPPCPTTGPPPTFGLGLNEHGHVVGYYYSCGIPADRPFLWTPAGGFQPLPMPDGAIEATASDINDEGVICGTALGPAIGQQGFVYENGQFTLLPPQPGGAWAGAGAINNAGQVVGFRSIGPGVNPYNAFIWSEEEGFTDLGVMNGPNSSAYRITEAGVVTGWTGPGAYSESVGFVWTEGQYVLVPPQPNASASATTSATASGAIGGNLRLEFPEGSVLRAFAWSGDDLTPLDALPTYDHSALGELRDWQVAVGGCGKLDDPNDRRAALWLQGEPHDLNTLIDPGTQLELKSAGSLNRAGQIVARGNLNGDVVAALLTPIDPSPGDISGDCVTDLVDLIGLLESWGVGHSPADYNTDGVVNVLDLLFLLANWG